MVSTRPAGAEVPSESGVVLLDRSFARVRVRRFRDGPFTFADTAPWALFFLHLGDEAVFEWTSGVPAGSYRVPPDGLTFWPPGVHRAGTCRRFSEHLLVAVAPSLLDEVLSTAAHPVELRPVVGARDPFAASAMRAIAECSRWGDARLAEEAVEALARGLVTGLARAALPEGPPPEAVLSSAILARVLDHVSGHLDEPLTLHQLSELAGMELYAFVRAFRRAVGLPPHAYVLQARVAEAMRLLRDPAVAVTDVALRTGFASPSHFSVTFRRIVQVSPSAFRREQS